MNEMSNFWKKQRFFGLHPRYSKGQWILKLIFVRPRDKWNIATDYFITRDRTWVLNESVLLKEATLL